MNAQREDDLTMVGQTNFRNQRRTFGIKRKDRRHHMYILGKTGTGKSTLLESLVLQDVRNGEGLALFDSHGDLLDEVVDLLPEERRQDVIYLNVPDLDQPIGFNPLQGIPPERRSLAAQELLEVMKKIWADSWGPRMEHILRNCLFTLLDQPDATLADMGRLLHDKEYRTKAVEQTSNPEVRAFWTREYESYPWNFRVGVIAPVENKVGAFLSDPYLRNIMTERKETLDLRKIMDEGRILLVNLAKGKVGEGPATLLGAMLVARIGLAGLSRADEQESARRDFYLYLDEFQTFATESLANMLSELRKYHVNLILANQHLAQLEDSVRHSLLGNVGTLFAFRVGPDDARGISREFRDEISAADLMNLPNYHGYVKLMVDGTPTAGFSAETFPPE